MEPHFGIARIPCPTHPTEPVVKVSLDAEDDRLLYCYECLQKGSKSNLVKYQDFIKELQTQYSNLFSSSIEAALPNEAKTFLNNQEETHAEFSRQIQVYKREADGEAKKIEKQIPELLQAVRASAHERLDQFEIAIKKVFDEFSKKVETQEKLLNDSKKDMPSQEDLNKRIFNTESTEEAEKNLRTILNDLKSMKELQQGTAKEEIERMQKKLEQISENNFIVPEKNEKAYASQIKLLLKYFEAMLSSLKEEPTETKEKDSQEKGGLPSELTKQKQASISLYKNLDDLNKQLETSHQKINIALEKKFKVDITDWECPVAKNGVTPVEGKAYKCLTCLAKYDDLGGADIICEDCRSACHKGHQVEYVETRSFVCQCQFTMRDCQLAVQCHYKYTASNSYRMATYKCKVCEMSSSRVLCVFCAKSCHEEHGYNYNGIQNTYCDCRGLFNFCKYHEQNQ